MGFEEAVQYLLNYDQIDNSALDAITPDIRTSYSGTVPPGQNEGNNLATWWLNRMVQTPRPLEEKMTLFWHNHFATAISKVQNGYLMYQQNQFLRANALGNFHDLLTGITWDGAMLVWLDGVMNRKNNPNQNYGREVMEVFSTGRGPYTQNDVIEDAAAFTGFSINSSGQGVFVPANHDDSIKTFLGQTGNFGPQDIVDILVARPETATNLATELFQFFGYPNPSAETIQRLSAVYFDSGYSMRSMVEAILTSPEFVSNQAYLANVKSPTEYVVGGAPVSQRDRSGEFADLDEQQPGPAALRPAQRLRLADRHALDKHRVGDGALQLPDKHPDDHREQREQAEPVAVLRARDLPEHRGPSHRKHPLPRRDAQRGALGDPVRDCHLHRPDPDDKEHGPPGDGEPVLQPELR